MEKLIHTATGEIKLDTPWWLTEGTTVQVVKQGGPFSKQHENTVFGSITPESIAFTRDYEKREGQSDRFYANFVRYEGDIEEARYGILRARKSQVTVLSQVNVLT